MREALRSALIDHDRAAAMAAAQGLADTGQGGVREGLDAIAAVVADRCAEHGLASEAIERLHRGLSSHGSESRGLVAVGTVTGDTHAIHQQLFAAYVRCAGFDIVDLGVEATPAQFAGAVREHRLEAVAVLCHATICAGGVARVIDELVRQRLRDVAKVLLAGEALTHEFARDAGADAYAPDPCAGVETLLQWHA